MENNKNLIKSQPNAVINTRTYDNELLKASLIIAFDRLNIEPFPIDNMINDIRSCYPKTRTIDITEAIKCGTMGLYGRTYRFSFQEVCLWIREYKKGTSNSHLFMS